MSIIAKHIDEIKEILLDKNDKYGNSSLSGKTIFGNDKFTSIQARIDDKLNRLENLSIKEHPIEYYDTITDLIGYLILYRISLKEYYELQCNGKNITSSN